MKQICIFLCSILCFIACSQDEEKIPNKVYIVNSELQNQTIYNLGEKYTYQLSIYKSGRTDEVGTVNIELDEAYLASYNATYQTSYKLLPSHYYTLSSNAIEIPANEVMGICEVQVDIDKIAQELGYTSDYVIPFKILSTNPTMAAVDEKSNVIIALNVLKPTLKFLTDEVSDTWYSHHYDNTDFTFDVTIGCDFVNESDIEIELAVDPAFIDKYNDSKGDVTEIMPEDAYTFPNKKLTLKAGENEVKTTLTIDGKNLKNWHSYAIPITVKSVSKYQFEETVQTVYAIYRPDNMQGWYTVEGLEKNTKDWSVSAYPIRRFIKKTGPYTYETGYGGRCYTDAETTAQPVNDRQYIVRDPLTNRLTIREGVYEDVNETNHYDPEKEELYICYEFKAWANWWTHEFMHSRSNSK